MKNNEVIQVAALVVLSAALLYRKYRKKKKTDQTTVSKMPGKSLFASQPGDEEYQPYSKKRSEE